MSRRRPRSPRRPRAIRCSSRSSRPRSSSVRCRESGDCRRRSTASSRRGSTPSRTTSERSSSTPRSSARRSGEEPWRSSAGKAARHSEMIDTLEGRDLIRQEPDVAHPGRRAAVLQARADSRCRVCDAAAGRATRAPRAGGAVPGGDERRRRARLPQPCADHWRESGEPSRAVPFLSSRPTRRAAVGQRRKPPPSTDRRPHSSRRRTSTSGAKSRGATRSQCQRRNHITDARPARPRAARRTTEARSGKSSGVTSPAISRTDTTSCSPSSLLCPRSGVHGREPRIRRTS